MPLSKGAGLWKQSLDKTYEKKKKNLVTIHKQTCNCIMKHFSNTLTFET